MPWILAGGAVGGQLIGGLLGAEGAEDAARAQLRASREAGNLGRANYLTSLGLQEPFRASGHSALNELNSLFGYAQQPYQNATQLATQNLNAGQAANTRLGARAIAKLLKSGKSISEIAGMGTLKTKGSVLKKLSKKGLSAADIGILQAGPWGQAQAQAQAQAAAAPASAPAAAPAAPARSGLDVFQASPDYQFRRDEGNRDILSQFNSQGGAFSGNALRALNEYNSNLASGEYQNFINRRMDFMDGGQRAAMAQQGAGNDYAFQGGNALMNMGDARASGIADSANIWGNAISGAGQIGGYLWGNRQPFNANQQQYQANAYLDRQFPRYG